MSTQVEIVLLSQRSGERLSVFLEPTGIPVAKRWVQELKRALSNGSFLEKDQSFCGFPSTRRSEKVLAGEINQTCEIIRSFRGEGVWKKGYEIPERCSPDGLNSDLLNAYHHHFELLRGQAWDPSPYFLAAVEHRYFEVENAIRKLNTLVHEAEGLKQTRFHLNHEERSFPFSIFHFLGPDPENRLPLHDEDYDHFSFEEDFGLAQLMYCQVGKTHYQAWCDKDEKILGNNINNLRYYSASFIVTWGDFSPGIKSSDLFLKWLRETGVDISNGAYFLDEHGMKQGLGFLNIARTPMRQFGGRSIREIQELLGGFDDVHQLRVHENGKVTEATYGYKLSDPDYQQRMAKRHLLRAEARP